MGTSSSNQLTRYKTRTEPLFPTLPTPQPGQCGHSSGRFGAAKHQQPCLGIPTAASSTIPTEPSNCSQDPPTLPSLAITSVSPEGFTCTPESFTCSSKKEFPLH